MSILKWMLIGLAMSLAVTVTAQTMTGPCNHGLGPVKMNPASPPDKCACEDGPVSATGTADTTCQDQPFGSPISKTTSQTHHAGEVGPVTLTVTIKWTCPHGIEFTRLGSTTFNFMKEACVTCGGNCDGPGSGSGGLKCVNLKINLGKSGPGQSAGYFWLYTNYPSLLLSSPRSLIVFHPADNVEIITDNVATGVLRQVLAPECLANIVTNSMFQYTIEFYFPQDISGENPESGYYEVVSGATPFATWTFENPAQSTTNVNTLKVMEARGGATRTYEYVYSQDDVAAQWSLVTGDGLRRETLSIVTNGTDSIETRTIASGAGVLASKVKKTYRNYAWGRRELVAVENDPDGLKLKTMLTYYEDAGQTGKYGRIASRVEPDGRWKCYDYNLEGRLTKQIESWLDGATNVQENEARVTEFSYDSVYEYYLTTNVVVTDGVTNSVVSTNYVDTVIVSPDKPRTTTEIILGQVVTRTYNVYYENILGQRVEIEERCAVPSAGFGESGNLRTEKIINPKDENNPGSERMASITYPDGRKDAYSYEFGVYTPNANPALSIFTPNSTGNYVRVTVLHGSSDHPGGLAWKSTEAVIIEDYVGRTLLEETYVYTENGFERITWTLLSRDEFGREVARESSNGARVNTAWACCGKESEKDENGIERLYAYDALQRLVFSKKVGVSAGEYPAQADQFSTYTYDAEGRRLTEIISAASLSQGRTNQYDLAGRLIHSLDFAGLATATAYSQDGLTTTEILPSGFTRITERFKDGQIKSLTGTAQISQYYEYGGNADGTRWTKVYSASNNSSVWVKTTTDFFGRTAKVEKPSYSTTEVTENFYNSKGQLVKQSIVNGPQSTVTLYAYDELGNQIRSGLDINGNGSLDLAGIDRITETDTSYELLDGEWHLVTVNKLYATDNSSATITNSVRAEQLTGLGGAGPELVERVVSVFDALGNETITTTTIDRDAKKVTQTTDVPDSSANIMSISVNGLMVSGQRSTLSAPTLFTYDALGRPTAATDPRLGTATAHYDSRGWVADTEDAAGNRTTFTYEPSTGRMLSKTDPLTNTTYFSYSSHGQLEKTWGSAGYPVLYEYDFYDRMVKMSTYRDGSGWSGSSWPANPELPTPPNGFITRLPAC